MLAAAIIGSGRSTPGLFSMRRRMRRLRRFNWRWTLAFTRKPPGVEQTRDVKYLDCSRKPGGFRASRPQNTSDYAWLRTNQSEAGRMDHPPLVESGMPIGSGVTEAACKVLVKQRLCGSGMKWKEPGA